VAGWGSTICLLKTMDLENGVLAGLMRWSSSMGVGRVCPRPIHHVTSHHIVLLFISSPSSWLPATWMPGAFGERDGNYRVVFLGEHSKLPPARPPWLVDLPSRCVAEAGSSALRIAAALVLNNSRFVRQRQESNIGTKGVIFIHILVIPSNNLLKFTKKVNTSSP
jgi:hypothetical protein